MNKELKKIRKEEEKIKKQLELNRIELRKVLDSLDKNFDGKLKCCLKTPPLKLKDLKEQLRREREGKRSSS